MSSSKDASRFSHELNAKLDEIIQWVVDNSPATDTTVSTKDFIKIREKFLRTANGRPQQALEPEEGGPQYISDNPAPWP